MMTMLRQILFANIIGLGVFFLARIIGLLATQIDVALLAIPLSSTAWYFAFTNGHFAILQHRALARVAGPPPNWTRLLMLKSHVLMPGGMASFVFLAFMTVLATLGFAYGYKQTSSFLFLIGTPAPFLIALALIGQRSTPPFVFYLACSSDETSNLFSKIILEANPLRAVSLIQLKENQTRSIIVRIRTREWSPWKDMVKFLLDISPLLILDLCDYSDALDWELKQLEEPERLKRVWLINVISETALRWVEAHPSVKVVSTEQILHSIMAASQRGLSNP